MNTTYFAQYTQAAWMLYNGTDTLTLSYGAKPDIQRGQTVWQVADDYSASKKPEWTAYPVTKVVIDDSVKNAYHPKSMAYWFSNMHAANATITNLANLDTNSVTNMESVFEGFAKEATSGEMTLDLSNFSTDNVSNMKATFKDCAGFTTLDVSGFNTSNVESFEETFAGCSRLTTLDTSKLTPPKAKTTSAMFKGASSLTSLDLGAFTALSPLRIRVLCLKG